MTTPLPDEPLSFEQWLGKLRNSGHCGFIITPEIELAFYAHDSEILAKDNEIKALKGVNNELGMRCEYLMSQAGEKAVLRDDHIDSLEERIALLEDDRALKEMLNKGSEASLATALERAQKAEEILINLNKDKALPCIKNYFPFLQEDIREVLGASDIAALKKDKLERLNALSASDPVSRVDDVKDSKERLQQQVEARDSMISEYREENKSLLAKLKQAQRVVNTVAHFPKEQELLDLRAKLKVARECLYKIWEMRISAPSEDAFRMQDLANECIANTLDKDTEHEKADKD